MKELNPRVEVCSHFYLWIEIRKSNWFTKKTKVKACDHKKILEKITFRRTLLQEIFSVKISKEYEQETPLVGYPTILREEQLDCRIQIGMEKIYERFVLFEWLRE